MSQPTQPDLPTQPDQPGRDYAHLLPLLQRIPGVDASTAVITPLDNGITNQNYRVDINTHEDGSGSKKHRRESIVLRVSGQGTHLLGIDRRREYTCSLLAAQVGVGAQVLHFFPEEEVLVTRYIEGAGLSEERASQPAMLTRIVASLRRYHEHISTFPGTFSPFETVRIYHARALAYGVTFPAILPQVLALMQRIEAALTPVQRIRPCHNDLLASNFIDDGHTIRIIDWEYAGMGDLFFDLGNMAVNHQLNEEQCRFLLQSYFGAVYPPDLAHLHLMRLSSDLREAFWGFLQLGISTLDFDYHTYGMQHLERFLHTVASSPFEQWLHDIQT